MSVNGKVSIFNSANIENLYLNAHLKAAKVREGGNGSCAGMLSNIMGSDTSNTPYSNRKITIKRIFITGEIDFSNIYQVGDYEPMTGIISGSSNFNGGKNTVKVEDINTYVNFKGFNDMVKIGGFLKKTEGYYFGGIYGTSKSEENKSTISVSNGFGDGLSLEYPSPYVGQLDGGTATYTENNIK
jgi:hypothetical protein